MGKDKAVPLPISAQLKRVDCASAEALASCSGSDDPDVSSPRCYHGSGGALGLTENVDVKISDYTVAAVDCSTAACPDQCQCGLDKCGDAINSCLADSACAASQECALACACSDTACTLKCAASSPSAKALPVATCLNSNCASVVV